MKLRQNALLSCLLAAAAATAISGMEVPELVQRTVMEDVLLRQCWGDDAVSEWVATVEASAGKCLKMEPTLTEADIFEDALTSPRVENKLPPLMDPSAPKVPLPAPMPAPADAADAVDPEVAEALKQHFKDGFGKIKTDRVLMMSNYSCVMKDVGAWKEDGSVDMDFYRQIQFESGHYSRQFRHANVRGYERCRKLMDGLPTATSPNPAVRNLGKQIFFGKCAAKSELAVCVKKHLLRLDQEKYGPLTKELAAELGLPADRYNAALVRFGVVPRLVPRTRVFATEMALRGEVLNPLV